MHLLFIAKSANGLRVCEEALPSHKNANARARMAANDYANNYCCNVINKSIVLAKPTTPKDLPSYYPTTRAVEGGLDASPQVEVHHKDPTSENLSRL